MQSYNVKLVFIMDGTSPEDKEAEVRLKENSLKRT